MKRSKGKWTLYQDLKEDVMMDSYLLSTKLFSEFNLKIILDEYGQAILKPVFGIPGEGYISIEKLEKEVYLFQFDTHSIQIFGKKEALQYLRTCLDRQKLYIVQQGVMEERSQYGFEFLFIRKYDPLKNIWTPPLFMNWKTYNNEIQMETITKCKLFPELEKISLLVAKQLQMKHKDCTSLIFHMMQDSEGNIKIIDVFFPSLENKWWQHYIFSETQELVEYLPETKVFWKDTFYQMIDKYEQIMMKPKFGIKGNEIIQVTKLDNGFFELHNENKKELIKGHDEVFKLLKKYSGSFIVQQRIPLAMVSECLFDLRVIMQKAMHSNEWLCTGILGRVAYSGYVVTNVAKEILSFDEIAAHCPLPILNHSNLKEKVISICTMAARQMDKYFDNLPIIGFDIAVDQNGAIWIIEANFTPDLRIFLMLEDKTLYQKMIEMLKDRRKKP